VPERLSIGSFMMAACGFVAPADLQAHVGAGVALPLTPDQERIRRGYSAPFEHLGRAGHAGPRRFPLSLPFDNPVGGDASGQARRFAALAKWKKPVHFIWGGRDDVFTEDWGRRWAASFPAASFDLLSGARHFLQETHGGEIARTFLERIA
jgi:pimeloyl-ACP methyl ester carboxylesterase